MKPKMNRLSLGFIKAIPSIDLMQKVVKMQTVAKNTRHHQKNNSKDQETTLVVKTRAVLAMKKEVDKAAIYSQIKSTLPTNLRVETTETLTTKKMEKKMTQ